MGIDPAANAGIAPLQWFVGATIELEFKNSGKRNRVCAEQAGRYHLSIRSRKYR